MIKGITEYSLTNFRSGTLNLSKLACYLSHIPAHVVVAMQRHQIIYSRILNRFNITMTKCSIAARNNHAQLNTSICDPSGASVFKCVSNNIRIWDIHVQCRSSNV